MGRFILRENQRLKQLISVRYLKEGTARHGIMTDLSLSGCAISGDAPVSVGMAFALHVCVPEEPEPLVIERVIMKWIKRSEFGVSFETLSSKVEARLTIIISMQITALHGSVRRQD